MPDKKPTLTGNGFFNFAKNFVFWKPQLKDNSVQYGSNVLGNNNVVHIGENKALERLNDRSIHGVAHDSSERDPPPKCHPGTRLDICKQAESWFHDLRRPEKIFWLHGPAGVGKSAIMQTLAESEAKSCTSVLGATIFLCKLKELNNTRFLFNTVAYQLAVRFPLYRDYIIHILINDPQAVEKAMKDQFDLFIVQPFTQEASLKECFERVLIVLDGLDEADGIDAQRALISMIGCFATDHPSSPIIWAIASRPEPDIVKSFHTLRQFPPAYMETKIEVDSDKGRADMELFLHSRFDEIRERYDCIPLRWPSGEDFLKVAKASSGHFIYGEMVTRFIDDEETANPVSQLKSVIATIDAAQSMPDSESNPLANLDFLYTNILSTIPLKTRAVTTCLLALSFMEWPRQPFNRFWLISNWLQLTSQDTYAALRKLHSILHVPAPDEVDEDTILTPFHKSFADFILSPPRSGEFHVANPLKLTLQRAIQVLDESRDPVTADIQLSRIKLHWSYEDERVDAVRHRYFYWSFWAVVSDIRDALSCDDNAPSRLRAFFQSVDFADSAYIGDHTISRRFCVGEAAAIFPVLESWGVARPITIQSIHMDRVRTVNAVDTRTSSSSGASYSVPSLLAEEGNNPWGEPPPPLAQCADWEDRLQVYLKSIENLKSSARVYLLGQGKKSAVGIFQNLDNNYIWYYVIPYDQS